MRNPSCWSAADVAARGLLLALVLTLAAAVPAPAATVLEMRKVHQLRPNGSVLETTSLRLRLDLETDLASWSPHPILLDENRTLVQLEGSVVLPGGKKQKIKRRDQDVTDWTLPGELHSSRKAHLVDLPAAPVGSVVHLDYQVEVQPYFPAGSLSFLTGSATVADLRVEVRGGDSGWRWHLAGTRKGLEVSETTGGVVITGRDLPALDDLEDGEEPPQLYYGWSEQGSWAEVGTWYEEILRPVTRAEAAVREQARQLTAGLTEPRAKLEALLAFLRRDVRYVAVEVGIGGYRPSSPATVLARRWGDCKDKALLLIDMLQEVGIAAHPVLIHSSLDDDIEAEFPSPYFNHLIVAVPADAVAVTAGDPVAEGLLFLDPTQENGSATWLHPGVQHKQALVVRGEQSGLVLTPSAADEEGNQLTVRLAVREGGGAGGRAELVVTGSDATAYQALLASPQEEQSLRYILNYFMPGAAPSQISWTFDDSAVPTLRLQAEVRFETLIQGEGERRSFTLPALAGTPEPQEITAATTTLAAGRQRTSWQLILPSGWCLPEAGEITEVNPVGSFQQRVQVDDRTVHVERQTDLYQARLEADAIEPLRALSLVEHRALRRRIRLACGE